MKEEWLGQFQNPDSFHRSFPFWGWNGKLDKEELIAQMWSMHEVGIGGFFIHSRDGLETDYMGEEWMACVKAVVEEAKKLDMCVWLYDEDRFPAGTAGGSVPAGGDAYRCKGLTLEVMEPEAYGELYQNEMLPRLTEEASITDSEKEYGLVGRFAEQNDVYSLADDRTGFIAAYAAKVDGDTIYSARRLPMQAQQHFKADEVLLAVRLQVSAPCEWFHFETPPDNLNPDCTRRFIALTHEKYKAAVGEEFGKTIKGIFTDEPSLHDRHCFFGEKRAWIPWTYGYGAYFRELSGYDFLDVLPWFYFHDYLEEEKSQQVRLDYWHSVSRRFGESYFKVIGEWCEENHLFFTGHFLQEDKMGLATRVNGAVMPNYQYQQIPGIDLLGEQTKEYLTVKQCTSVARQLGKKYVLSETYGCTGWDFTFEGQKWVGDWQYVLGVNRRCQHMALYSLRGCRKRDYPPSFNYNTNWWAYNRHVEDYFARLGVVAEQGKAVVKVLLMHPESTVWSRLGSSPYGNPVRKNERDVPALNAYGERYNELLAHLLHQHFDVDLGDEMLLEQFGGVEKNHLCIGEMSYSAVVLPPDMAILSERTRERIYAYMEQGGFVYAMEPVTFIGKSSELHAEMISSQDITAHRHFIAVKDEQELLQQLEPYRTIRIENGDGIECTDVLYQLRHSENGYFLMLINHNRDKLVNVTVTLPFCARVKQLDLLTGEIGEKAIGKPGAVKLQVALEACGSVAYFLEEYATKTTELTVAEQYLLDRPNVLPLDMCRYRIEGAEWSAEKEIWQAQQQIREYLGMRQIYHNGLEQRYKWVGIPHEKDGSKVELAYQFEVAPDALEAKFSLAVEQLSRFRVNLNGSEITVAKNGWLLDKSFETMSLSGVRAGLNELILSCEYCNDMELENIYLAGGFGVSEERRIVGLPERLPADDWTKHGLKHYCGSVTWIWKYESEGNAEEVLLKLPDCAAVCIEVQINGNAQVLPWNFEKELSIGEWIKRGCNEIVVKVVGSPRNMMGPFHLEKKPSRTNDAVFCPKPEQYCEAYFTEPYGLFGAVTIAEFACIK